MQIEFEKYITDKKLSRNVLEVHGFIPRRQWARDTKITIKTRHIKVLISDEFEILETIKEDTISNSASLGYPERGLWAFKVKKLRPIKNKKPVPEPVSEPDIPKVEEKIEQGEIETPPEPTPVQKKPSTKGSFRGRISKIAKNSKTKD